MAVASSLTLAGIVALGGTSSARASTARAAACELHVCATSVSARGIAFASVSCTSVTHCTAVGDEVAGSQVQPVFAIEAGGAWRTGILPASVAAGGALDGVSCASATACVAAGSLGTGPPAFWSDPITVTEIAGTWDVRSMDPDTTVREGFSGVSCTSATDCSAVGDAFLDSAPYNVGLYDTETAVGWGPLSGVGSDTQYTAPLLGVSCTSATVCTAVGGDGIDEPVYATEASGTWGAETVLPAPHGGATLDGVSCTSGTDCTAIGVDDNDEPVYTIEIGGVWGPVTEVAAPGGGGAFAGVSCTSVGDCTAVGDAVHGTAMEPLAVTETDGVWGHPILDASPLAGGQFAGVSCTSGRCTAVGSDGHGFALYPTEVAGVWPTVPRAPRIGRAIPGDRSVRVTWAVPTSDGGSSVTSYTASAVTGGRTSSCTSRRSCVITGLTNGVTYTVSVLARNAAGSSASSATRRGTPRA